MKNLSDEITVEFRDILELRPYVMGAINSNKCRVRVQFGYILENILENDGFINNIWREARRYKSKIDLYIVYDLKGNYHTRSVNKETYQVLTSINGKPQRILRILSYLFHDLKNTEKSIKTLDKLYNLKAFLVHRMY